MSDKNNSTSGDTSISSSSSTSQLSSSLLRLKLLDALRGGDNQKIDSIINELASCKTHTLQTQDIVQLKETIFHYAVQVASLNVLQFLISNSNKYNIDINAQDKDGNTPLHLAAMANRLDIVKYLLSLPNINDTIVNLNKKQPVEVCKDVTIAQLMQFERAKFVEKSAGELRAFFSNRDFQNLENLLVNNPRASELLDINGADPETGNTVLHEFISKNDIEMCDWILKHGGDPFKRDKRGKLPIDLVHSNDRLKKLLKSARKDQNIMDPVATTSNAIKTGNAPTYKGYLRKWTNFASGYKLRYFILDSQGILSYYTNQEDTNNACRGSINLAYSSLHLDSSEKSKFEIHGKNGLSWHLKANHPIETNRWVWTLQNAITIAKDNIKRKRTSTGGGGMIAENDESSTLENPPVRHSIDVYGPYAGNGQEEKKPSRLKRIGRKFKSHSRTSSQVSLTSFTSESHDELGKRMSRLSRSMDEQISTRNSSGFEYGIGDLETGIPDEEDDYDSDTESSQDLTPLNDQAAALKRSLDVELACLLDLFEQANKEENLQSDSKQAIEVYHVGKSTIESIVDLIKKYNTIIETRDSKLKRSLERQLEINKLWESSIQQLEQEMKDRETKLLEYQDQKKQLKRLIGKQQSFPSPVLLAKEEELVSPLPSKTGSNEFYSPTRALSPKPVEEQIREVDQMLKQDEKPPVLVSGGVEVQINDILGEDSDNDEFFDADEFEDEEEVIFEQPAEEIEIEEKLVPSVEIAKAVEVEEETAEVEEEEVEGLNPVQKNALQLIKKEESFKGYENPPRKKLSMDEDNRPKVGLWGILKSMIGKDMTRMTLPVSFNEPTSLLQRLTEDIEYCSLLDQACQFDDSTLRLIYVATFAATEYSSTINRIAKPFNPLLGETFEYCRPDQNYRLIVEQVSHHPPISACHADSPKWDYYGENAVDSKFTGRSFDFKHLGRMFCVLRPDHGVVDRDNKVVPEELYTWKKVNTAVVGIMLGNPTVDNYGKMIVENRTTGDSIIVDLKQRGWRASSAYQLSGQALDRYGKPQWAMGGHWNSKIYAKKIPQHESIEDIEQQRQRRNSLLEEPSSRAVTTTDPFQGSKFLVWQVAPRPKVPFNLTQFAVTLNGIDDNLKSWLAPTDTRLRPDQRAMENGEYDFAADEKHRVEVKQRAARKARDESGAPYIPNWFIKKKHPITGDAFWEFNGKYWKERQAKRLADTGDIF
ncbi:uncharacterized protein J8A68_003378 [[Candida] subhashii]|uniref:PH domain-containing protein n=1 Tax=[Candida] subhashii TaxID=561895 RepID=A0A8J5UM66_9ASCO|nr:uncharacterized protein J8A68_003378 [[Candida] subhashii]KAG7663106.1 hypothetical protein J8A68_003378 [[Candida] subhashii]